MTFFTRLKELIVAAPQRFESELTSFWRSTKDFSKTDYSWWDRARAGKIRGMEIAALFLSPLYSKIAAWVMGTAPVWVLPKQGDYQKDLNTWWDTYYSDIMRGYEESLALGDCALLINPDLTITVIPPNEITPVRDPEDPSNIIGWQIVEKFADPKQTNVQFTITDTYTAEKRVRSIQRGSAKPKVTMYPNLIGKVPIVMISNIRGADEQFGRSEAAALPPALLKYGDVLDAATRGNIRQGRPTPVIRKMGGSDQVDKFWARFGRTKKERQPDGTIIDVKTIPFDPDKLLTLSGDAEFSYESPGSFSHDTEVLLGIIFMLIVQHTEVPEFVWGVAISSTKSSTETQFEPFVKWIEKRRGIIVKWMTEISDIVLRYQALVKPGEMPIFEIQKPAWRKLMTEDGRLTLDTVAWAFENGIITSELAAKTIPIHIPDPEEEVASGAKQFTKRENAKTARIIKQKGPDSTTAGNPASSNKQGRNDNQAGNPTIVKPSGKPQTRPNGRAAASGAAGG